MEDQGVAKSEKGGEPLSISFPSVHVTPMPGEGRLVHPPGVAPGRRTDARICPDRPGYRERPGKNSVYNAGCNEEASTITCLWIYLVELDLPLRIYENVPRYCM